MLLHRQKLQPGESMLRTAAHRVATNNLQSVRLVFCLSRHRCFHVHASKSLMVVESPAKADKIQKFLGDKYQVLPSYGHVRDLPSRSGSVDPDNNFAMAWELSRQAIPRMAAIETAARSCSKLLLATDPDREGEAIAWHVEQELRRRGVLPAGQGSVERVTFTEVTENAVQKAIKAPRAVSVPLVDAYRARRGLDHLFGFTLSPLLWRKMSGARSAGRVQSVALRLVCERENDIEAFNPQEYWSIAASFNTGPAAARAAAAGNAGVAVAAGSAAGRAAFSTAAAGAAGQAPLLARLVLVDGQKLDKMSISNGSEAEALQQRLEAAQADATGFVVASKNSKTTKRSPLPPFITSTLQQEASRKLGFSASRTMSAAQQLYEGANTGEGLITYTRTDGVNLSPEAVTALRSTAAATFGADYIPPSPRVYKSRSKNAQEAHEAIRPTSPAEITPEQLPASLTSDQRRLYELIWRRAVGSQMADAQIMQVAVDVANGPGDLVLRANGSSITFPGYLAASGSYGSYGSSSSSTGGLADESAGGDDDAADGGSGNSGAAAAALLALREGQRLGLLAVDAAQHSTKPPGRYTEGTLVKALEERGIGRPSTYAPILKLLRDRGYVDMAGKALVATPLGRVLDAFLKFYFPTYVDYGFTSSMEDELDDVAGGRVHWRDVLHNFWGPFNQRVGQVSTVAVTDVYDNLQQALLPLLARPLPDGSNPLICPSCGGQLALKPSRATGAFLGCTKYNATGCSYSRPISIVVDGDYVPSGAGGAGSRLLMNELQLGVEPVSGQPVLVKQGPYGLYVQQGDGSKAAGAPPTRRMPLPEGSTIATTTLQQALELLAPPRPLGPHPDDQEPITVQKGRFGPYVAHRTLNAPLPKGVSVDSVSLEDALAAIEKKVARLAKKGIDPYAVKPGKGKKIKATKATKAPKATKTAKGSTKGSTKGSITGKGTASNKAGGSKSRAPSAYQLFYREQRTQLLAEQPPGANSVSVVAAAWRALTDEQKGQWQARAKEEAVQEPVEMQEAEAAEDAAASRSGTSGVASSKGKVSRGATGGRSDGDSKAATSVRKPRASSTSAKASKSNGSGTSSNDSSGSSANGGEAAVAGQKPPTSSTAASSNSSKKQAGRAAVSSHGNSSGPRPLNGYQLYVKENGERLRQAAPPGSKAFAVAADAWKALSASEKAHWQELARQQAQAVQQ